MGLGEVALIVCLLIMKRRAYRSRSRERAIDSEEEYYRELERET